MAGEVIRADGELAVVTGGNRGLGFEVCRQLARLGATVILTSRDSSKGEAATAAMRNEGLEVTFHRLDVTDRDSIEALKRFAERQFGPLDILVNNAGIVKDGSGNEGDASVLRVDPTLVRETFETNALGPLMVSQVLVPLMRAGARIVNVSSGMGQLAEMEGGYTGYRLSKVSLNALTRIFAAELKDRAIKVNSVCPGWVRTDMGGPSATRTPEQGADTIVWLATLPDDGPTGGFFRDRKPIAW